MNSAASQNLSSEDQQHEENAERDNCGKKALYESLCQLLPLTHLRFFVWHYYGSIAKHSNVNFTGKDEMTRHTAATETTDETNVWRL